MPQVFPNSNYLLKKFVPSSLFSGFVLGGGDSARLRRQFGDQFGNQFFPQNLPQNNFGNGFDVFGPFTFPDGNQGGNQFQGNQVSQGGNPQGNQGNQGNWNQGPPPPPPRTTPPNNQNNRAPATVATTLAPAVVECSEACNGSYKLEKFQKNS